MWTMSGRADRLGSWWLCLSSVSHRLPPNVLPLTASTRNPDAGGCTGAACRPPWPYTRAVETLSHLRVISLRISSHRLQTGPGTAVMPPGLCDLTEWHLPDSAAMEVTWVMKAAATSGVGRADRQ